MSKRYPLAGWKGDGKGPFLTYKSGPFKVVLHTTETVGLPNYLNGYHAPHLTYDPVSRLWWQHFELDRAARALRNGPDPVETNRDSALQVEIICYSNKVLADNAKSRLWVGNLNNQQIDDIHQFVLWCHNEFGVQLRWPGKQALSYAQANAPGFKLSTKEWDAFDGVCGHQHVPDTNDHWDPGALNWNTVIGQGVPDPKPSNGVGPVKGYAMFLEDDTWKAFSDGGLLGVEEAKYYMSTGDSLGAKATDAERQHAFAVVMARLARRPLVPGPQGPPGPAGQNGEDGTLIVRGKKEI